MRYVLCVAYNGAAYQGWAKQPKLVTIQAVLEAKLTSILRQPINLTVAARTDKHVHAVNQYCQFDLTECFLTDQQLWKALNRALPNDIWVKALWRVQPSFHVRFCAKSKVYLYIVNTNEFNRVFQAGLVYQYKKKIDLAKCNQAVRCLIGKHDFSSFTTEVRPPLIREIYEIKLDQKNDLVFLCFHAPSFLRAMVRMLTGCILAYNEGKLKLDDLNNWLAFPKKGQARYKVPGDGLYLVGVNYS